MTFRVKLILLKVMGKFFLHTPVSACGGLIIPGRVIYLVSKGFSQLKLSRSEFPIPGFLEVHISVAAEGP